MKEDLIAKLHVELKYMLDPIKTERQFVELYEELEGKRPGKRVNLLKWFFDSYRWDGISAWEPRERLN